VGIVVYDYALWAARYPELSGSVDQIVAQGYFDEATMYLDNTDGSIVRDVSRRAVLLGMITAHIAKLYAPIDGKEPSQLVGRITNASEGSVSVATDYGQQSASAAFWLQTKYGASYWQASAQYRTFRYSARPRRPLGLRWP
jgi:hypothetical protein